MTKQSKLGRGLDILLSQSNLAGQYSQHEQLESIPVNLLQKGKFQPRDDIDSETLKELSQSIKAQGIIQPIVAREVGTNQYEIIAGERRWRAAQLAGLETVPVLVREISDQMAVAIGLIENIQREGLTPLEEANALQRLIKEFSMTHDEVASAVGRSRSAVTNLIRLLQLNGAVKKRLNEKEIQMGHGRALLALSFDEQPVVATKIVSKSLSVRQAEQLVKKIKQEKEQPRQKIDTDPRIDEIKKQLSDYFASKIEIKQNPQGKGRISIHFDSFAHLTALTKKLK